MLDQKISELISSTLNELGYDLVQVKVYASPARVEILIDKLDCTKVSISDCKLVSNNISALLDVEDVVKSKYYLEVSSAGVERPLNKIADYQRYIGRVAQIKLKQPLNEKKKYLGVISSTDFEHNSIALEEESTLFQIPFDLILQARLVLTEDLFRNMLNSKHQVD